MHKKPIKNRAKSERPKKFNKQNSCSRCFREHPYCICDHVTTHNNNTSILILQHPQEQFKILNSAPLAHLTLSNSTLKTGLSWPNLKAVTSSDQNPSEWAILYLKSENDTSSEPITLRNRKSQLLTDTSVIKGIIAIDGSWKQAKTLWWRNPWFLRLKRITINPNHPSLRKQVKSAGLSTIEAIAAALENLDEEPTIAASLREQYRSLIIDPAKTLSNPNHPAPKQ
ncbi:DTW domain-containing protein [Chitinispirillales bacterium ANBcel5]|uniref:tRNA-uridine aminocarboxypropyltransferase n=1 Tax=Cellulosispirillum alkaliphilum TaxID=3039283 RepID=UPI002A58C4A0|nr:DTW domain-containing protein [Chitinispirillales bacterium ANBcel5]